MPATLRRRGPDPYAHQFVLLAVAAVLGTIVLAVWLRSALVLLYGGLAGAAVTVLVVVLRRGLSRRPEIDRTARYLAAPWQVRSLTTAGARESAARLGARTGVPGIPIGTSVRGHQRLWGSWEDMHFDIWGPRTGKTATRAIPAVVSAPGAVVVTSNKRDIVDATRGVRERRGPVWVFDPQNQAGEPASWWWNPLTFINNNIVRAMVMASLFAGINRPSHAQSDGYFEPAGQELFAAMLLAAHVGDLPITRVLTWLRRPNDDTALQLLRDAGHDLVAASMEAVMSAPALQRAGVYGTAAQIASSLSAPDVARWVTPGDGRPEFRHSDFARQGNGAIYLLSEETNKMAAPLVLSLVTALAYEFEGLAIESPQGRLPVPAVFVLDEAANICPWEELPLLYTHYGSRGIIMMTIIQSWAQGVEVWGESGMASMWGAANIRVYGGGSGDTKFLGDVAAVSPNFEAATNEISYSAYLGWDQKQTLKSRSEEVLDVAVLGAMPRGRAWLQVSGSKPILMRTTPWWEGPHADAIRDSLARYAPASEGRRTPTK